jgi:hypothetical protein
MLDQTFGRIETGADRLLRCLWLTYKDEKNAEYKSMCKQEHCKKASPSAAGALSKRSDPKTATKWRG